MESLGSAALRGLELRRKPGAVFFFLFSKEFGRLCAESERRARTLARRDVLGRKSLFALLPLPPSAKQVLDTL